MSYSFSFTAKDRAQAKERVITEFDRIVEQQPIHARDEVAATNAALAFIDLIAIPDGREISVTVSGSLGWSGVMTDNNAADLDLVGGGVNVSVSLK